MWVTFLYAGVVIAIVNVDSKYSLDIMAPKFHLQWQLESKYYNMLLSRDEP